MRGEPVPIKHPVKIVMLGAVGVGKSALLRRFSNDGFSEEYNPSGQLDSPEAACISNLLELLDTKERQIFGYKIVLFKETLQKVEKEMEDILGAVDDLTGILFQKPGDMDQPTLVSDNIEANLERDQLDHGDERVTSEAKLLGKYKNSTSKELASMLEMYAVQKREPAALLL